MNYELLISFVLASVILIGCGSVATQAPEVEPPPTTTTSPTTAAATATEPTMIEPTSTDSDQPLPTATPAPEPTTPPTSSQAADIPDLAGNPDLDYAQVLLVQATENSDGRWRFDATVRHNDEGWDHYADAWQVVDLEGNLLAERILTHPHDTEQPFTRSQSNIDIPPEMTQVIVRAKCTVHGFGGQEVLVDLTVAEGENFEVTRN